MKNNYTVKDLPPMERPYEKCLAYGPKALSDGELLAVVLKTGTREKTSVELARELLTLTPGMDGLPGIYHLTLEQLKQVKGIGDVKAIQILCICEIAKRLSKSAAKTRLRFESPSSIAQYFMEEMRNLEKEEVRVLFFDGSHGLICDKMISVGTVNAACSSPREIYLEALRAQAVYLILIHNHPSGNPVPSKEDFLLTKRMKHAGELLGIELSDHIIIGNQAYYSFREEKLLFE